MGTQFFFLRVRPCSPKSPSPKSALKVGFGLMVTELEFFPWIPAEPIRFSLLVHYSTTVVATTRLARLQVVRYYDRFHLPQGQAARLTTLLSTVATVATESAICLLAS